MTQNLLKNLPASEASQQSAQALSQAFLRNHPRDAARKLETLAPSHAAEILSSQASNLRHQVWRQISTTAASTILISMEDPLALDLLTSLDASPCARLLANLDLPQREYYFKLMKPNLASELRDLLDYPTDSAGNLMDTRVLAFHANSTVFETIEQLKRNKTFNHRQIFTLDEQMRLQGKVGLESLVTAEHDQRLSELSLPIADHVFALDPKEEVADKLKKNNIETLPVVDVHHRLLGVIRGAAAVETLTEDIAANLQTMVGVSRNEQALSSSWLAVRMRQPWLQINLLTGFLAAAVVGLFETTIAQFTALAVLMPIAAGQSGNTGAQALAVTMRGLTLREITTRHWLRIMLKEAGAGLINGLAIAITCGIGVYIWSQSVGLAFVLALAIVISMTIAGIAGACVPIILKKLGQDPAQSSSIILTTITDIAGFTSFLGIAALLSRFLT